MKQTQLKMNGMRSSGRLNAAWMVILFCVGSIAWCSLSLGAGTGPRMMQIALADLEDELPPPGSPFILEVQVAERETMNGDDAGEESATPTQRSQQIAAAAQSSIDSANAGLVFSSVAAGPAGGGAVSISPASDDRVSIAANQAVAAERAAAAAAAVAAERSAAAATAQRTAEATAAQQLASVLPIQIEEQAAPQPVTTPTPAPTPAPTRTPAPTPVNNTPTVNPNPPVTTPNPEPINPEPINPEPVNPEPVNPEPVNPGTEIPPEEETECPSDEPCEGVELSFGTATKPTELVSGGKALFFRSARASKSSINLRDQKHLDRICLEIFRAGRVLPPECRDHIHPHKH